MAKFKSGDYFSVNFTDNETGARTIYVARITSVFYDKMHFGYNYQYEIIIDHSDEEVIAFHQVMWSTFCFESDLEREATLLNPKIGELLYGQPNERNLPSWRR